MLRAMNRQYLKSGEYRRLQTLRHRNKLNKNTVFQVRIIYSAILLGFVMFTFFNTLHDKPTIHTVYVKQKTSITAQVAAKKYDFLSLTFPQAYAAFSNKNTPTIIPTPTGTDNWDNFKQTASYIAKIYNYPLNLLLAQAALESGHGTSNFAVNRNNYFGIGAYDWQPDQAFLYDNPAQSIIDYIYVVKDNFPEAWNNRNDAATMLNLLENNSDGNQYASDPDYISKVMSEPEWNQQ